VRLADRVVAYRNRCPHRGVTLNWQPGDFLAPDGDALRCATHDARFRLHDGLCVAGPWAGRRLAPLAVEVRDGTILVAG
jgi:nitrite reductase/ring-hydroxylating ferredoxin subunit